MSNRIRDYFAPDPAADTLLQHACGIKLELLRCQGDDPRDVDTMISFEVHGCIDEADAPLLSKLLAQFKPAPKAEGGAV